MDHSIGGRRRRTSGNTNTNTRSNNNISTLSSDASFSQHSQSQRPSQHAHAPWTESDQFQHGVSHQRGQLLLGILSYCRDLLVGVMLILRPLLSLILAMAFVFLILVALTRSMVAFRSEVQSRILCNLPLVNHLVSCPSASSSPSGMHIPNFAELVNKQARSYELIADSLSSLKSGKDTRTSWSRKKGSETVIPGAGDEDPYGMTLYVKGMPLPLLLKRAELAVVDLKVLVKHSALAEPSKHLLVEQLESFHTRAKVAGRKLQFLQARANGCVDGLVIRNVYLTIELDRLEEEHRILKEQQESNWGRVWNLLSGSNDLQLVASEVKLHQLYQTTMSDARDHIRDLIVQAQDVLQSLDAMDQILSIIHEITTKEKYHQNREHDKILAQLWSHLGGNRLEKRFHRNNLELLQDMEGQRKATVGQIQAALWKLTDFEAEIGILREKLVGATIDAALGRVGKEGATIKSPEGGSDNGVSSLGSDASSLRSHIQQIDLVTSRLKERSFLADALIKEQADLPSPASS